MTTLQRCTRAAHLLFAFVALLVTVSYVDPTAHMRTVPFVLTLLLLLAGDQFVRITLQGGAALYAMLTGRR